MTPLEKAVEAGEERGTSFGFMQFNEADANAIITAFLEAAAEDRDTAIKAGHAADSAALQSGPSYCQIGKAAILALKETING